MVIPASGLVGRYGGSSWNSTQWTDLSGAGNHATIVRGSVKVSEAGFRGAPYIYGTTSDGIRFPAAILPATYTLFHVAKYNGATKGRIFDGVNGGITNWLSGFHGAMAGKAYHNNWITPQVDVHGSNWVFSTDQNALYRSNKVNRTIAAPGTPSYDQISINYGIFYTTEPSDWACAEVIVYNRTLTIALQANPSTFWVVVGMYTLPVVVPQDCKEPVKPQVADELARRALIAYPALERALAAAHAARARGESSEAALEDAFFGEFSGDAAGSAAAAAFAAASLQVKPEAAVYEKALEAARGDERGKELAAELEAAHAHPASELYLLEGEIEAVFDPRNNKGKASDDHVFSWPSLLKLLGALDPAPMGALYIRARELYQTRFPGELYDPAAAPRAALDAPAPLARAPPAPGSSPAPAAAPAPAARAARGARPRTAPNADPAAPLDEPPPPREKRARAPDGSAAQPAAAQPAAYMDFFHPYMEHLRSMGYTTERPRGSRKRPAAEQPILPLDVVGDGSAAAALHLAPPAGPRALAAAALDLEVQRVVDANCGAGVYSMFDDNTLPMGTATFLASVGIAHDSLLSPGAAAGALIPVGGRLLAQIATGPAAAGDALFVDAGDRLEGYGELFANSLAAYAGKKGWQVEGKATTGRNVAFTAPQFKLINEGLSGALVTVCRRGALVFATDVPAQIAEKMVGAKFYWLDKELIGDAAWWMLRGSGTGVSVMLADLKDVAHQLDLASRGGANAPYQCIVELGRRPVADIFDASPGALWSKRLWS
jgi:hypothetical protein